MNALKKALTKDDIKRYQKNKNVFAPNLTKLNGTYKYNKNNLTDVNQLI
jgi:hypothetical protein